MARRIRRPDSTLRVPARDGDEQAVRVLTQTRPLIDIVIAQLNEIVADTEEAAIGVLTEAQDADVESEALVAFARALAESNGASAQQGASATKESADQVEKIVTAVSERYAAVLGLLDDVRGLERYVETITSISRATNILALNAKIEAARSGTAGEGFAVVASEVQALAAQSSAAAEDVRIGIARISAAMTERLGDSTSAGGSSFGAINDQLQSIVTDQRHAAELLGSTVADTHAAVQKIEESAGSLNRRTSAIVARAQFQDLARQSVESVITALAGLNSHIAVVGEYLTDAGDTEALIGLGDAVQDMSQTYTSHRQRKIHAEATGGSNHSGRAPEPLIELF